MLVYQQVPATVPAGTDAVGRSRAQEDTCARGSACAATGGSQRAIFRLIQNPLVQVTATYEMLCASPLLQLPLLQSSVLQRLMCVDVWALGCLLELTLCLLTFNLDSSIDMLPTGGGHNFLDVRYYPARQLSAISKSLNLTIICRAYTKKAFV